ncbi:hypothetical protein IAD21_00570 [Abditibacteriota bacterium]|nr:hypothetical protein IAD21_00570 [Abditibacteriota bacterium]
MALQTAAAAERFLSNQLNGLLSLNGKVYFLESLKHSGGNTEKKKIGINSYGRMMNQPGEKNPVETEAVLMVPQADYDDFLADYRPSVILDNFYSPLLPSAETSTFGNSEIESADIDAAILENDVVKLTVKVVTLGYGTDTTYTAPA